MFRPFKGEIVLGKITSGTEHGVKSTCCIIVLVEFIPRKVICILTRDIVGIEFFNDILVPPSLLLDGARL